MTQQQKARLAALGLSEADFRPGGTDRAKMAALEKKIDALQLELHRISEHVLEVIKQPDSAFPAGDYLNPIAYAPGMAVEQGLFYTDGSDIWEARCSGVPADFADRDYFDVIEMGGGQ